MVRVRQKTFVLALASVVGSGVSGGASAAPATAVAAPFSPSGALAQIGNRKGYVSYATFGQQGEPANDRSLAPYLTVLGEGSTERVPLKETTADVSIAGVIARVQVHQLFENTGRVPIEAVYVFPASTRAAVPKT